MGASEVCSGAWENSEVLNSNDANQDIVDGWEYYPGSFEHQVIIVWENILLVYGFSNQSRGINVFKSLQHPYLRFQTIFQLTHTVHGQ